jgi:hypothetical protein
VIRLFGKPKPPPPPDVKRGYQIALRYDDLGLDDVVVKDVKMFRMERMDDAYVWMCCYLNDGQVIHFDLSSTKRITYAARSPLPNVKYEEAK